MRTFPLPDLGEGLEEAEIVLWHVSEGEHVVADQPLVSVETDKAVMEIPSPWAGTIAALHGSPGERVAVGAPLVDFEERPPADAGAVVGALPAEAPRTRVGARAPHRQGRATPAVRALARRLGVDLDQIEPTGPEGTVSRADVERAARELGESAPLLPLEGVRRAMADAMARSHREVVPATITDEVDVEGWPEGTDVTVRLLRAMVEACAAEPALNAWYEPEAGGRRLHRAVDVAIAIDTEDGLFAPVLRNAGSLSPEELRRRLDALEHAVATRTVALGDLRRATITLSNFGTLGGRHAALVVLPPQVAILGTGRIAPRVIALEGLPAVRRTLPLSLTFDHRVVTGGEAARFLAAAMADLGRDA